MLQSQILRTSFTMCYNPIANLNPPKALMFTICISSVCPKCLSYIFVILSVIYIAFFHILYFFVFRPCHLYKTCRCLKAALQLIPKTGNTHTPQADAGPKAQSTCIQIYVFVYFL